ncbi:hypothetical protein PR048_021354 [Dryococelus australis]|uniref:Uncharacterized protein n=1 Tax=Dryococelus australis TaxID=614101 RepID=A0ABQ9GY10_9NEOP|nr:hypothetical protein PR048_021354 [Dryococelus australis]
MREQYVLQVSECAQRITELEKLPQDSANSDERIATQLDSYGRHFNQWFGQVEEMAQPERTKSENRLNQVGEQVRYIKDKIRESTEPSGRASPITKDKIDRVVNE